MPKIGKKLPIRIMNTSLREGKPKLRLQCGQIGIKPSAVELGGEGLLNIKHVMYQYQYRPVLNWSSYMQRSVAQH